MLRDQLETLLRIPAAADANHEQRRAIARLTIHPFECLPAHRRRRLIACAVDKSHSPRHDKLSLAGISARLRVVPGCYIERVSHASPELPQQMVVDDYGVWCRDVSSRQ